MKKIISDVVIIGAGPAGAIAGALLAKRGWAVNVNARRVSSFFYGGKLTGTMYEIT